MRKVFVGLLAVSLVIGLSGPSLAQDKAKPAAMSPQEILQKYHIGPYAGVSGGLSSVDTGIENTTGSASVDEEDIGFKVFGGYQFTHYLAAEAHYARLGTATLSGNTGDTFDYKGATYQFTADAKVDVEGSSIGVAGVAGIPVTTYLYPYLKGGVHRWSQETSAASSAGNANFEDSGVGAFYGLGARLRLTGGFSVRAEFERFKMDEDAVDFISLGGQLKF